jgi:mRNA interferase RelE/StbE
MPRAAEQGLAPDKALGLKMAQDVPIFTNVRFAGEACC